MSKLFKAFALFVAAGFMFASTGFAAPDVTVPIPISVTIGAQAEMTVTIRNISDNAVAPLTFTNPLAEPWTVADQYLNVVYTCNLPLYAIRIVSDNITTYPNMYGKPIAPGPNGKYDGSPEKPGNEDSDDICSYAGLIDSASATNPDNRALLAWQVYAAPIANPGPVTDESLKGVADPNQNWDAPWAAVVDKHNTNYNNATDSDGDVNTIDYQNIVLGGAAASGLNYHPAEYVGGVLQPKPGDGDIAVYLAARFKDLSAGTYGSKLMVELVHE